MQYPIGQYIDGTLRYSSGLYISEPEAFTFGGQSFAFATHQQAGPNDTTYKTGRSAATAMTAHRKRRLSQKSVMGPRRFRASSLMPAF